METDFPGGRALTEQSRGLLRAAYTLWAPFYDAAIRALLGESRARSLSSLGSGDSHRILIDGVGTGLDLPLLPRDAVYVGIDLTPAMLRRARTRARRIGLPVAFAYGNAMALPFRDAVFSHVVMHLILAVVPTPSAALNEAARVVKPGGLILIFDKFLRRDQRAPLRRRLSPFIGRIATHTDVVFEDVFAACPILEIVSDESDAAHGWFRRIVLRRTL